MESLLVLSFGTILLIIIAVFMIYTVFAVVKAAPYVPTLSKKLEKMIKIAELRKTDILMDLGSGDGRVIRKTKAIVKKAIGVEINPILSWYSRLRLIGSKNTQIIREDLWKTDLSEVDVLFIYFISNKMDKLMQKIKKEMKPGSRIVSHCFIFPDWEAEQKDDNIRLYIV